MSVHKHRILDTNPVVVPVTPDADGKAQQDIAKGSLVALDSTYGIVTPENFTWDTDLATTQAAFVAAFVGVSQDRVRAGHPAAFYESDNVELEPSIMTAGEFDVYVVDATYEIGDLLGPNVNGGADGIINRCVEVANTTLACFRVIEDKTTSATNGQHVRARLISVYNP